MKHDKYVNNWSQKIELIAKTYSTKKSLKKQKNDKQDIVKK